MTCDSGYFRRHRPAHLAFERCLAKSTWAWLCACIFLLGLLNPVAAQQKSELKDHPFFKRVIGEWSSEEDRKYADGNVIKIKQEWKTSALGEGTVTSEGTRDRNGQTSQFRWTFSRLDSGLVEAVYQLDINKPDTRRYEVQLAEDGSRMELTALLDNNAKYVIVESFKAGEPDTMETEVTRTDGNGAVVYTGTGTARRKR